MRLVLFFALLAALLAAAVVELNGADLLRTQDGVVTAGRAAPRAAQAGQRPSASRLGPPVFQAPPLLRPVMAPPSPAAPQPGEQFTLVGMMSSGAHRIIYLRDQVSGQVSSSEEGAVVGSWTVLKVEGDCAVLVRRRQRQRVCR